MPYFDSFLFNIMMEHCEFPFVPFLLGIDNGIYFCIDFIA